MTDLYARMGIDVKKLGCVMLNVSAIDLHRHVPDALWYRDPETPWINGPELEPHITLLFGLMESAHTWREYVDEVMEGWTAPEFIGIRSFERFGGPTAPYDAIVGVVNYGHFHLKDAHQRLSRLPHINTFPYQPHLTVGYVVKGTARYVIRDLNGLRRDDHVVIPAGLNYGDVR